MERLRLARLQRGWSQQRLAEASGLQASTITRLEQRDAPLPKPATVGALSRTLDVELERLLSDSELTALLQPKGHGKTNAQVDEACIFGCGRPDELWHVQVPNTERIVVAHSECVRAAYPAPCCQAGGTCGQDWS